MHDEFLEEVCAWLDYGDDRTARCSDMLVIASGYQSGGCESGLELLHGEIMEDVVRYDTCAPVDIKEFLEDLKNRYRSLELIPCPGHETQVTTAEPDMAVAISEEQVRAQIEHWGTDFDWQFVRQVYRQYGWPHDFRWAEATDFIERFMAQDEERRGVGGSIPLMHRASVVACARHPGSRYHLKAQPRVSMSGS